VLFFLSKNIFSIGMDLLINGIHVQNVFWTKVFTTKNGTKRKHLLHKNCFLEISHLNNANPSWDDLKLKCHRTNCSQILNIVIGFLARMWEKSFAYKNYNQYNPYWCPKWNTKLIKSIDHSFTCLTYGHETIYGYEIGQKPSMNSNSNMKPKNCIYYILKMGYDFQSTHSLRVAPTIINNKKTTTTPK